MRRSLDVRIASLSQVKAASRVKRHMMISGRETAGRRGRLMVRFNRWLRAESTAIDARRPSNGRRKQAYVPWWLPRGREVCLGMTMVSYQALLPNQTLPQRMQLAEIFMPQVTARRHRVLFGRTQRRKSWRIRMLKASVQPERDAVIHLFPVLGRARFPRHVLVQRPAEQVPKVLFLPTIAFDSVGRNFR